MSKIVFLDFDGPMIPMRAAYLPGQTAISTIFDPCAVSLLNELIVKSTAKVVISSSWGRDGYDVCAELLEKNGISRTVLHEDWVTPRKFSSQRIHEIKWWLDDHPEVTHYVAIDDEDLPIAWVPNAVLCDSYEGFSFRNYLECKIFLGIMPEQEALSKHIAHLKRREINRTVRRGEHEQWKVAEMANDLFQ